MHVTIGRGVLAGWLLLVWRLLGCVEIEKKRKETQIPDHYFSNAAGCTVRQQGEVLSSGRSHRLSSYVHCFIS